MTATIQTVAKDLFARLHSYDGIVTRSVIKKQYQWFSSDCSWTKLIDVLVTKVTPIAPIEKPAIKISQPTQPLNLPVEKKAPPASAYSIMIKKLESQLRDYLDNVIDVGITYQMANNSPIPSAKIYWDCCIGDITYDGATGRWVAKSAFDKFGGSQHYTIEAAFNRLYNQHESIAKSPLDAIVATIKAYNDESPASLIEFDTDVVEVISVKLYRNQKLIGQIAYSKMSNMYLACVDGRCYIQHSNAQQAFNHVIGV